MLSTFSCPVDKTTAVVKSIKASMARFTTEAFKFIADHPFVFVHCEIRICDARNSNSRCAQGCITEIRERRDVRNDDVLYPLAQGPLTISSDMTLNLSSARKSALQGKQNDIIDVVWVELGCVRLMILRNENTHKFLTNFFSLRTPGVEKVRNRDWSGKGRGFGTIQKFSKRFVDFTKQWKLKQMIFRVYPSIYS